MKQKQKNNHTSSKKNWKDEIANFLLDNVLGNYIDSFLGQVGERWHDFQFNLRKKFLASIFFLTGMIFLMAGLAVAINELVGGNRGIGYLAVGVFIILCAMRIESSKRK